MKKLIVTGLIATMLLPVMLVSACDEAKEGKLPELKTGDKWVSTIVLDGNEYTMTQEVTGEEVCNDKECYITQSTFDPPVDGDIYSRIVWYEISTMLPVEKQFSYEQDGDQMIVDTNYSYELTGAQPYPLEVGMEYTVVESGTTNTTNTSTGEMSISFSKNTYIYKIEKIENITVPAGIFKCFKIVQYDETGTTVLKTIWQSDKTGQYIVKETDQDGEITRQLQSYSLK